MFKKKCKYCGDEFNTKNIERELCRKHENLARHLSHKSRW